MATAPLQPRGWPMAEAGGAQARVPQPDGAAPGHRLFVERTDEWRRALGWTHARFAASLGLSVSYWQKLRTGDRPLTLTVALRVLHDRPELAFYLSPAISGRPWRGRRAERF